MDVVLENPRAAAAMQYYARGRIWEASVTSEAANHEFRLLGTSVEGGGELPETLLRDKVDDPVAAAFGAYVLLRLGDLDGLHDWTGNLLDWFDWLPDGIPIRAEHLARMGDHRQALLLLLRLPQRGLPIFSDGVEYAAKRLRMYESDPSLLEKAGVRQSEMRGLLRRLERVGSWMDFRRPTVTYTGAEPVKPDANPIESVEQPGAIRPLESEEITHGG